MAVADERDVYGEIATLLDEFLGTVERINQEELGSDCRHSTGGNLFLCNDRYVRGYLAQSLEDDGLGSIIGIGDWRCIDFVAHINLATIDVVHNPAGLNGGGNDVLRGDAGDDTISGGGGDDFLDGGTSAPRSCSH